MPTKAKRQKSSPTETADKHSNVSIKECFDTYADEDGGMSIQRAKRALQELLQVKVPREELSAVTNQDERFDWKSFSRFASSKIRQKKKSDKAFSLFDVDDKGLICQQDVERVAGELGEELSPEEVEEMMNEADPSGDGLVDREAFFRIVRRVNLS